MTSGKFHWWVVLTGWFTAVKSINFDSSTVVAAVVVIITVTSATQTLDEYSATDKHAGFHYWGKSKQQQQRTLLFCSPFHFPLSLMLSALEFPLSC